jgi:hypothetical protein
MEKVKNFILTEARKGNIGVETMDLYNQGFSVTSINAAIRELIDFGEISISCPSAGFRLTNRHDWNKQGVEISLRTKNFDIRLQRANK